MSFVALVLLACGSKDEGGGDGSGGDDSSPPVTDDSAAPVDADRDGVTEAEDCNENDPTVHPGAKEICNGRDDDCDEETDEGLLVSSYADEDADGWGDDATEEQVCYVPHDAASVGGDCDDGNDDVHPDADEVCDDLDNDCDELVDDDDELDEGDDWYLDEDGDGYGGDKGILTCEPPGKGYDNVSTDCDDADPDVFPSAFEVCGDGVIQDCNRSSGDSFASCNGSFVGPGSAGFQITTGSEETIAFADLTGDGTVDVILGATIADALEAGVYVFPGPLPSGALDTGDATALLAPSGKESGVVNVASGPYDGDGADDLVVGTPAQSDDGREGGAVYVELGPVTTGDLADADLVVVGDDPNARIGSSVEIVADSSGDSVADLLVAAGGADGDNEEEGAVWILEGGTTGSTTADELALAEIRGTSSEQRFGAGVTMGDLTGDGVDDLVVGNGESLQVAYVFEGPVSGTMTDADADFQVTGGATDFGFGLSPITADLDGDGASDLLVPAYGSSAHEDEGGRVLAWSGPLVKSVDESSAMLDIEGANPGDYVGGSLQAVDVDGDAAMDLVVQGGVHWTVGSSGNFASGSNAGWLFFGPLDGTMDTASSDIEINAGDGDRFARVAPDVDGDDRVELVWDTTDAVTYFSDLYGY